MDQLKIIQWEEGLLFFNWGNVNFIHHFQLFFSEKLEILRVISYVDRVDFYFLNK